MTTAEPVLRPAAPAPPDGRPAPATGAPAAEPGPWDPTGHRALRDVLGRYATGVAVVTTTHRDRSAGVTVNSFTSVSLDPPLILWCLGTASRSRDAFTGAGHFAVHVLAAGRRDLATRFTRPGDRFAGLAARPGPYGLPLLAGAVAVLICRRDRIVPAGDHLLLLGAVQEHRSTPGPALLFADGAYHRGPDGG